MNNESQNKLHELLRDFYNLTGIKVSIHDSHGEELCYYPAMRTPFCALLRKDCEMDEKCRECDRRAVAESKKLRKRITYTCHAGLIECFAPVLYREEVIGYIALGQIKPSETSDFNAVKSRFPARLQQRLQAEYDALPVIDTDKIKSAVNIVDACTGYEYLRALVDEGRHAIENRIAAYIEENITANLSIDALCRAFHLSRNEIYHIFREYRNASPAEYVKMRRLTRARTLLKETDYPVHIIARKCGIPDYNYFSKIFKRAFGISPRDFRKKEG